MKQKNMLGKKLELYLINCAATGVLKVLMVNHGFYTGKKINDLKNDILDKISVQMTFYYTQIEENSNFLGGMFSNIYLIFPYSFEKIKIFYFSHNNGAQILFPNTFFCFIAYYGEL